MMARVVVVAFEDVEARRVDLEVQFTNIGGVDLGELCEAKF